MSGTAPTKTSVQAPMAVKQTRLAQIEAPLAALMQHAPQTATVTGYLGHQAEALHQEARRIRRLASAQGV